MSGTSYGACILHVAPESAIGGPLALVRDGDLIMLDVEARTLSLGVSDEELAIRKAAWKQAPPRALRGYLSLFLNEVTQADEGCDFRFLHAGTPTPEPAIHESGLRQESRPGVVRVSRRSAHRRLAGEIPDADLRRCGRHSQSSDDRARGKGVHAVAMPEEGELDAPVAVLEQADDSIGRAREQAELGGHDTCTPRPASAYSKDFRPALASTDARPVHARWETALEARGDRTRR